jgi:hypothetical protein
MTSSDISIFQSVGRSENRIFSIRNGFNRTAKKIVRFFSDEKSSDFFGGGAGSVKNRPTASLTNEHIKLSESFVSVALTRPFFSFSLFVSATACVFTLLVELSLTEVTFCR